MGNSFFQFSYKIFPVLSIAILLSFCILITMGNTFFILFEEENLLRWKMYICIKKGKKENLSQLVETIELLQQLLVIYWIIHLDVFRIDYSADNHKIVILNILTLRTLFILIFVLWDYTFNVTVNDMVDGHWDINSCLV